MSCCSSPLFSSSLHPSILPFAFPAHWFLLCRVQATFCAITSRAMLGRVQYSTVTQCHVVFPQLHDCTCRRCVHHITSHTHRSRYHSISSHYLCILSILSSSHGFFFFFSRCALLFGTHRITDPLTAAGREGPGVRKSSRGVKVS